MSAHCQQEVCSKFKFSYLIFKSITSIKYKAKVSVFNGLHGNKDITYLTDCLTHPGLVK